MELPVQVSPGVIEQLVAPAVMIPACGLLLLSTTARLNTVLGRIRAFHHEQLEVWRLEVDAGSRSARVRDLRLEGLGAQTERLLKRVKLMRITMLLLFFAISCNLLASLGLAGELILEGQDGLRVGAITVFICGLLAMLIAMATSAREVWMAMGSVRYEHERVERLTREDPRACGEPQPAPAEAHRSTSGGVL